MHARRLSLLALALCGCASTLTTHQLAKAIKPGHAQVNLGAGAYVPVGTIGSLVGEGVRQVEAFQASVQSGTPYQVTPEDQQRLLTAAIALAVLPPSLSQELTVRTGILQNWDAGLRYSINAVRLDSKYQLVHQGDDDELAPGHRSFDVSVGLGVSRYLFDSPAFDVLDYVQMGDFSRWDLEVPVYVSWEWGEWARAYLAPKYVWSRTELDANLVNTSATASLLLGLDVSAPETVDTHFFGTSAGVMLGYKYAFLVLEMTGGYTLCRPYVLGQRRDLGGLTLYPSAALDFRF